MSKYRNITFIGDRYETEWFMSYLGRPSGDIKIIQDMPLKAFYTRLKHTLRVEKAIETHLESKCRYLGSKSFMRLDGAKLELILSDGPKLHVSETFPYSASLDSSLNSYPIQIEEVYFKKDSACIIEREGEQQLPVDVVKAAIANSKKRT